MQTDVASREKQPELFELHYKFQENGKRLNDVLSRIKAIGDKLSDDSQSLSKAEDSPKALNPRNPGIVNDLYNTVEGYGDCISQIERKLTKIEQYI